MATTTDYRSLYMSQAEYVEVLKNLLSFVKSGIEFNAIDSAEIGDKYTTCSWGLCCDHITVYNRKGLNQFHDDFISRKRVAPKYFKEKQKCPHDTREGKELDLNGCFFTCVYKTAFDRPKQWHKMNRETAIIRIEELIKKNTKKPS